MASFSSKHAASPRRGRRRLLVILLFILTGVLSWYARQGRNNPFADRNHVIVAGSAGAGWIVAYRERLSRMNTDLVFLLERKPAARNQQNIVLPEDIGSWTLISSGAPEQLQGIGFSPKPPSRWIVLDTTPSPVPSEGQAVSHLPPPEISAEATGIPTAGARMVQLYREGPWIPRLEYGGLSLMLFPDSVTLSPGAAESPFKENTDLAVVGSAMQGMAAQVRQLLRPKKMVVTSVPDESTSGAADGFALVPSSSDFRIGFRKSADGRIHVRH